MRLVTYDAGDGERAGMVVDGRVVDAWAALGEPHRGSLKELLEHGRIDDLHARIGDTGAPSHPLSAVTLLQPGAALTCNFLKVEMAVPREPNSLVDLKIGGISATGLCEMSEKMYNMHGLE